MKRKLTDNNVYLVTVRSTDVRPAGTTGAAPTSTVDVIVTVTNLDEPGTATISLRQPEVGTGLTGSATDPDEITGDHCVRVVRPQGQQAHAYERHAHWQDPEGTPSNVADFEPGEDDEGKYLRLKATYRDGEGGEKAAYVRSEFRVRADVVTLITIRPRSMATGADTRKIPENADVRDAVGSPVVATDPNKADSGRLTYSIVAGKTMRPRSPYTRRRGRSGWPLKLDHELGSVVVLAPSCYYC